MRKFSVLGLLLVFVLGVSAGAVGCSRLQNTPVNDPALLTNGLSDSGAKLQASTTPATVLPAVGDIGDVKTTEDQVIKDFQSDILNLFKAWKAENIDEFQRVAGLGLSGVALENRVSEARELITEGLGAYVNPINYKSIKLTSLKGDQATVDCQYSYSGYDYNVVTGVRGEKFPTVEVNRRYQLQKQDNRWLIISEQEIQ